MMRRRFWLLPVILCIILYLGSGCTGQNKEAETIAPVVFSVDTIEPATASFGDIITKGIVYDDAVEVTLSDNVKDPEALLSSHFADILVTSYRVSFERIDGGTDVPAGFEHDISYRVPANGTTSISNLVVVKAGQKLQPPIGYLLSQGVEPVTNYPYISCNIHIEFTGETEAGYKVYARGSVPITFADYADE
jgi:hypothetical protein